VFASADIYFSMDSKKFSEFPVRWTPKRDVKKRDVTSNRHPVERKTSKIYTTGVLPFKSLVTFQWNLLLIR